MNKNDLELNRLVRGQKWVDSKCDKYDYMIAAFCGFSAGIIDSFFVKTPGIGPLGNMTDRGADIAVSKVAQMLWQVDGRSFDQGKSRRAPDNLVRSISYLEQSFPVNFDARYAADLKDSSGQIVGMNPRNHHLMSLAHSPDIIGLLFSILDQFTGQASFISQGKLIRLYPIKDARNNKVMYMQGTNFESRIFCGICNWLGHIMSDLVGSSSTRQPGKVGRGAGLPIPFYELFLTMQFGDFDGETFADIAVRIFQEGYDLRHGAAMSVPIIIMDLAIKLIWAIKQRFYHKKPWKECIPSQRHADLRMMIIVGNATLCLVDGADAAIRSLIQGGNALTFALHLNLIAWARLIILVFREIRIRYGGEADLAVEMFLAKIGFNDGYELRRYYQTMNSLDQQLDTLLKDYIKKVEREYEQFMKYMDGCFDRNANSVDVRMKNSISFAETYKVKNSRIFYTPEELRYWLGKGWENKK